MISESTENIQKGKEQKLGCGCLVFFVLFVLFMIAEQAPCQLNNVSKGRQAEAKNYLGMLSRENQAYRLKKGKFAALKELQVGITGNYYVFSDAAIATEYGMAFVATAKPPYTDDIRDYAVAIGQTADGGVQYVICEAISPQDTVKASPGNKTQPPQCIEGKKREEHIYDNQLHERHSYKEKEIEIVMMCF